MRYFSIVGGLATLAVSMGMAPAQAEQFVTADLSTAELQARNYDQAIVALERTASRSDPGALINLGHAYQNVGRYAEAEETYRAAIASLVHYDVQLIDGSRIDSREAARMALARMQRTRNMIAGR